MKYLVFKNLKKWHKKKSKSTGSRLVLSMSGIGLILAVSILIQIAGFTAGKSPLAELLPQEETVAFLEIRNANLSTKLKSNPGILGLLSMQNLIEVFLSESPEIQEIWKEKNKGMALLKIKNEMQPVFSVESKSQRQGLKWLGNLSLEGEPLEKSGDQKNPIYHYKKGQNLYFTFAGHHLFISDKESPLHLIQSVKEKNTKSLADNPDYQKTTAHLPKKSWLNGYINVQGINLKQGQPINNLLKPLSQFANQFSWTIRSQQNGLHFNTFLSLKPEATAQNHHTEKESTFNYGLSEMIDRTGLGLYVGGANLADEWQNTLETISKLNPAYGILMEGIVRAQVEKSFGAEVSLRNDIYPLFEGQYGLAIGQNEAGKKRMQLILTHNDPEFIAIKLQKLMQGFELLASQFVPKIKEISLPDGTVSRELIANSDALEKTEETFGEETIHCTQIKNKAHSFCYTITRNSVILSNTSNSIKTSLDNQGETLAQSPTFREALGNLSQVSDEITFLDFEIAQKWMKENSIVGLLSPYLKTFDSSTWVKHNFKDGVSTEGFVLIK